MGFSVHKSIKGKLPSLPFIDLKNTVLGKEYNLSLVFIGSTRSKTLNKIHRKKNHPANILSFSLSDDIGEIFIDLIEAGKNAKDFSKNIKNFTGLLFIHGLLHLKGFEHGSSMDSEELKVRKKFNLL